MNEQPIWLASVVSSLGNLFESVERGRGIIVSPYARNLVEGVLVESIDFGADEWLNRFGVKVDNAEARDTVLSVTVNAVQQLLARAEPERNVVTLVSLQREISLNPCKIFPFCR